MSYWPVGNKFVGVIESTAPSESVQRKHHIWIEDQSGSMDWAVRQVAEDMVAHLKDIPQGDVISVGYFSGVGDYRWWLKGYQLTDQRSYDGAAQIIKNNAHSRNTTCFSEILADVPRVIADTDPLADAVELVFLTDGHPVVPSYERERSAIFKAIKDIKDKIATGLLVGYGDYYNRPLMVEMAQALGATLQHADDIRQFGKELGKIVVKTGKRRVTITLPKGASAAFAIEEGRVVVYGIEDGKVSAPKGTAVYFVADRNDLHWTSRSEAAAPSSVKIDPLQPAYASALLFVQQGAVDEALAVLSDIGDIAIVERLGSAITNKEYGEAEQMLQEAAVDPAKRFLKGKRQGCAPREDAFDLIDLLTLLQNDPKAKMYPRRPDFKYKRIGRSSKTADGYPEFVADEGVSVPISSIIGNATELNLSVGLNIPGTVDLPESAGGLQRDAVKLPSVFDAHIYRTYNLIANALPNVTNLPVSVGYDTFLKLHAEGLVPATAEWTDSAMFVLDLTAVPACNRKRGKDACNWEELAKKAVQSTILGNRLKVLKDKLRELDPDKEQSRPVTMTADQQQFLAACGIKADGTYSPPQVEGPSTDILTIRTFEIKVAKSSPVSMKDFMLMVKGDKKLNWVGEQMMFGQQDIDDNLPSTTGAAIQWLGKRIGDLQRQKRSLDADINARRYAIALGGHWHKYHKTSEAEYVVTDPAWPRFQTASNATVTFVFKDNVEKKI